MTNFEKYNDPQESWNAYIQQTEGHIISQVTQVLNDGSSVAQYKPEAGYSFWLMCDCNRFRQQGL